MNPPRGRIGVGKRVHVLTESLWMQTFWYGVAACGWAGWMFPTTDPVTCWECKKKEEERK